MEDNSCRVTRVAGAYGPETAPTRIYSPLLGMDLLGIRDSALELVLKPEFEYGILLLEGEGAMDGDALRVNELVYLGAGRASAGLTLRQGGRAILVGGEPLDDKILLWWNFVGRDKGPIARAQRDWGARAGERRGGKE